MVTKPIDLTKATIRTRPFPFFYEINSLDITLASELLAWFETSAPWKLVQTDFYEQFEFSLTKVSSSSELYQLTSDETLDQLKIDMGRMFKTQFTEQVDITAHKLVRGQRIRIHNDFIPGKETHRLLLQLNREWTEDDGGLLLILADPHPESASYLFQPQHRLGFGFAISRDSYHAVSKVNSGERFTLVYSFYEKCFNKELTLT